MAIRVLVKLLFRLRLASAGGIAIVDYGNVNVAIQFCNVDLGLRLLHVVTDANVTRGSSNQSVSLLIDILWHQYSR
jgi:hypothetical protein